MSSGFQRIADAVELAFDVVGLADIAVGLLAEVEFHAGRKEPFQRHLVDLQRRLAAILGAGEMPRRVEMGAVVGGERDLLHRRAFAVGKLLGLESRKPGHELLGAVVMIEVFDARQHARRIGGDAGLERH